MASSASYAELHCLSNFTFLRGASHPEELVEEAARLGYSALALTDECSFAGIVRAHTVAKDLDIKLIIGTELCLSDGLKLIVLAPDRVYQTQSRWFPIPRETFDVLIYAFLGLFKIVFLVFNLVPYLALLIVA